MAIEPEKFEKTRKARDTVDAWFREYPPDLITEMIFSFDQLLKHLHPEPHIAASATTNSEILYISDGRTLSKNEFQNLNMENYAIVLNMIGRTLHVRKDPENHSVLLPIPFPSFHRKRLAILIYLLEHPQRGVCLGRLKHLYSFDERTPTSITLRQTIRKFRLLLGQTGSEGPYIITRPVLGDDGAMYVMDSRWSYLVIKENNY